VTVCDANGTEAARRVMVAMRQLAQCNVLRKLAAALVTSYVVGVVQSLKSTHNCGVAKYYDEMIDKCRNCRLLCDPEYGTPQQCADKCPGNYPTKPTYLLA